MQRPVEQKYSEKLTILNQRGQGLLIKVYNLKRVRFLSYLCSVHYTVTLKSEQTWCVVMLINCSRCISKALNRYVSI